MKSLALATIPCANTLPGLSDAFVSIGQGLEVQLPADAKSGDSWVISLTPFKTPDHLATTTQGDELFITSNKQILSSVSGNLVFSPNDPKQVQNLPNRPPTSVPDHKSNVLVSFFNHLFLVKGRTLWWTDLDNPWEWLPHPHSEADFRAVEWESHDCTGLARSADKLYMHFPTAIYEIAYTGKPSIISLQARVHGIGCVTPQALSVHNGVQFFIGTDNFYAWSSEAGLNPIGRDIWKKFYNTCPDITKVWCYVDQRHNEVCWVSGSTIWAFNFIERHWQKYSTDGIKQHSSIAWTSSFPQLDESLSIIEPVKFDGLENICVGSDFVCREQGGGDSLSRCVGMTAPYLETDDVSYGDLHLLKRTDLVMLDMRTSFPWVGVKVYVSGRHFMSHPDNWEYCGLWTQELFGKQIDFLAVAGKVLKFKFVLVDGLNLEGVQLNGGLSLDGKRLDVANGEIIMDGSRSDFLGKQSVLLGGTETLDGLAHQSRLNFAEIRAWGERVDLPQSLVGPDK